MNSDTQARGIWVALSLALGSAGDQGLRHHLSYSWFAENGNSAFIFRESSRQNRATYGINVFSFYVRSIRYCTRRDVMSEIMQL